MSAFVYAARAFGRSDKPKKLERPQAVPPTVVSEQPQGAVNIEVIFDLHRRSLAEKMQEALLKNDGKRMGDLLPELQKANRSGRPSDQLSALIRRAELKLETVSL